MKITTALFLCPLWLCLTLLAAATTSADIYKTVDAQGRTVYTDTPPPNQPAEAVELPELNTQPPVTAQPRPAARPAPTQIQYQVTITAPANGTQIPMGQQEIPVSLRINPNLRDGAFVQILLNGTPVGATFEGDQTVLTEVYRGEHLLQAAIYDRDGVELTRSDSITLYVQRQSKSRLPRS